MWRRKQTSTGALRLQFSFSDSENRTSPPSVAYPEHLADGWQQVLGSVACSQIAGGRRQCGLECTACSRSLGGKSRPVLGCSLCRKCEKRSKLDCLGSCTHRSLKPHPGQSLQMWTCSDRTSGVASWELLLPASRPQVPEEKLDLDPESM